MELAGIFAGGTNDLIDAGSSTALTLVWNSLRYPVG